MPTSKVTDGNACKRNKCIQVTITLGRKQCLCKGREGKRVKEEPFYFSSSVKGWVWTPMGETQTCSVGLGDASHLGKMSRSCDTVADTLGRKEPRCVYLSQMR